MDWAPCADAYEVTIGVGLDREEISQLFLLGDMLISWPTTGLVAGDSGAPLARGCMYLSELQGRPCSLRLGFAAREEAENAVMVVRMQLAQAERRLGKGAEYPKGAPPTFPIEERREGSLPSEGGPPGGVDRLREVVAGYLDLPGVTAALLVSGQGFLIASAESGAVDGEAIAALVADVVGAVTRLGAAAGGGMLDNVDMEFREFGLTVVPFDESVSLVLVRPSVAPRIRA
ncbi:MAG: roadblock/LC7 domain-containing protein [Gaiellales bacterium]|nr:roadblock/LC7 domain-containing protein [Gaiellales bacterium]